MVLVTLTATEAVKSTSPGDMSVCEEILSVLLIGTITVQDGAMKFYRFVVEINKKASFEDGCGRTHGY